FSHFAGKEERRICLHEALGYLKNYIQNHEEIQDIRTFIQNRKNSLEVKIEAGLLREKEIQKENWVIRKLEEYDLNLKKDHIRKSAQGFEKIKEYFQAELQERKQETQKLLDQTEKAFQFLEEAFGDSQEMVLF